MQIMKYFKKSILNFFKILLLLTFVSCEQEVDQVVEVISPYKTENDKLKQVLKPLGLSSVKDFGTSYIDIK